MKLNVSLAAVNQKISLLATDLDETDEEVQRDRGESHSYDILSGDMSLIVNFFNKNSNYEGLRTFFSAPSLCHSSFSCGRNSGLYKWRKTMNQEK